jgi:Na+/melibiose symporter-like transporter
MPTHNKTTPVTTRWAVPGAAVIAGVAYLVAGMIGGDPSFGVVGLALMLGVGVVFVVASRWSETAAGLRERTDERINQIDRSASLVAGMTVLLIVLVMFVVEIAQGKDGSPYSQLGAVGGVTYLVALIWFRFRR